MGPKPRAKLFTGTSEARDEAAGTGSKFPMSRMAVTGFLLSSLALAAVLGAGTGTRFGYWDFRQGFKILNWAACIGVAGTAISLGGAILARLGRKRIHRVNPGIHSG